MAASIFNGSAVKILKDVLRFKSGHEIQTGDSDNPTSVAKTGEPGFLYFREGTSEIYVKTDSGSSTNWSKIAFTITPADQLVEYRTISAGEATAKQLTLIGTPSTASETLLDAICGTAQRFTTDFTVSGAVLDWNGLGLDTIGITAGDEFRIVYFI